MSCHKSANTIEPGCKSDFESLTNKLLRACNIIATYDVIDIRTDLIDQINEPQIVGTAHQGYFQLFPKRT